MQRRRARQRNWHAKECAFQQDAFLALGIFADSSTNRLTLPDVAGDFQIVRRTQGRSILCVAVYSVHSLAREERLPISGLASFARALVEPT